MSNEIVIPPDIKPESGEQVTLIDDQTFSFRPQFGRGWSQRNSFGDPRWQFKRSYRGLRQSDRNRMHSILTSVQGGFRTIMVSPAQEATGSFPDSELAPNADFSQGTTGWTSTTANAALTAADGVARSTLIRALDASIDHLFSSADFTVTQYAPYVLRVAVRQGRLAAPVRVFFREAATGYGATDNITLSAATPDGYYTYATVLPSTLIRIAINSPNTTGQVAGDFLEIPFVSASQCFLVDAAASVFDQSDAQDHANWTKNNVTVTADFHTSPNGAATAERQMENGVNTSHSVDRSFTKGSLAEDWCVSIAMRQGSSNPRRYVCLRLDDGASSNLAQAFFDLQTGVISTAAAVAGTFTNARAYISSMGNSWYFCSVVGRTSTGTTIRARTLMSSDGSSVSYAGDTVSNIGTWGFSMAASSVPMRLSHNTSSSTPTGTAQSGTQIYVKGLPASTTGLLNPGDWIEIDGQLKMVTQRLDSNAAGLGYLSVRGKIVRAVADNTPIIVCKPMGRFVLGEQAKWNAMFGLYADYDLTLDEIYE